MNQLQKFLVSIDTKNKIRQVELEAHWDNAAHAFMINRFTGMFGGKISKQPVIVVQVGKAGRTVTEQAALQFNSKLKEYKDKKKKTTSFDSNVLSTYDGKGGSKNKMQA